MPLLKHVTGSKQRQFLPPLLYFDKFFCPAAFPKTYERAAVGIYLLPHASAFHPGPFPVACTIFATTYLCCRKEIFLLEGFILVGKICPCRKDLFLSERYFSPQHNFRLLPTHSDIHKDIFLSPAVRKISFYLSISFFPLCSITDLPLGKTEQSCL